jgi:hypothetical protein
MDFRFVARAARSAESGASPPASLYLAAPFSMGYVDFFTFLIPLYGLSLGLDAEQIGVLVGARSPSRTGQAEGRNALFFLRLNTGEGRCLWLIIDPGLRRDGLVG